MQRRIFTDDHELFRKTIMEFIEREVQPHYADWEAAGEVPRSLYNQLGDIGVIGINVPTEFDGGGNQDYAFNVVIQEAASACGVTLGTLRTHLGVVVPYFLAYASTEQQARWFPGLASGRLFTAIALTEPDTGSDLAGVTTSAVRDGDEYVLNGAKTFITGGLLADLVIVLARTSTSPDNRRHGLTLLVVESGMPGFTRGRKIEKIGLKVQDTVELFFEDVRVPVGNRLGDEDEAFSYLSHNLAQERLTIAVLGVAECQAALQDTVEYVRERRIFGKPVGDFQNTKFELAALSALTEAAQAMCDRAVEEFNRGTLSAVDAAKVKLFCTETQGQVMDRCLQLHGGYGYTFDSPIARHYVDARVTRIYGGTSEVMKTIISKDLGL
jgi:acyl-CoA dehydrogenase